MSLRSKRYAGLPLLLAALAFGLILGMGDQPIYAYTVHGNSTPAVVAAGQGATAGGDAATVLPAPSGAVLAQH